MIWPNLLAFGTLTLQDLSSSRGAHGTSLCREPTKLAVSKEPWLRQATLASSSEAPGWGSGAASGDSQRGRPRGLALAGLLHSILSSFPHNLIITHFALQTSLSREAADVWTPEESPGRRYHGSRAQGRAGGYQILRRQKLYGRVC